MDGTNGQAHAAPARSKFREVASGMKGNLGQGPIKNMFYGIAVGHGQDGDLNTEMTVKVIMRDDSSPVIFRGNSTEVFSQLAKFSHKPEVSANVELIEDFISNVSKQASVALRNFRDDEMRGETAPAEQDSPEPAYSRPGQTLQVEAADPAYRIA